MLRNHEAGWMNPKVLTFLGVIFLCGVVVGCEMTRTYLHSRMFSDRQHEGLGAAQRVGLSRLKTQLNLTGDQERVVMKVLDDYAKYYQNIEDEREDVAEHGEERILTILTPDQQKKFTEMFGRSPH